MATKSNGPLCGTQLEGRLVAVGGTFFAASLTVLLDLENVAQKVRPVILPGEVGHTSFDHCRVGLITGDESGIKLLNCYCHHV